MAKILIVDDQTDAIAALTKAIQTAGHEVTTAPNGREALSELMRNTPDVVLLDLLMPEMDGLSFLEAVRSYLRLQSLPVVVLTALADDPMIERIQQQKVNAVLVKGQVSSLEIVKALEEASGAKEAKLPR